MSFRGEYKWMYPVPAIKEVFDHCYQWKRQYWINSIEQMSSVNTRLLTRTITRCPGFSPGVENMSFHLLSLGYSDSQVPNVSAACCLHNACVLYSPLRDIRWTASIVLWTLGHLLLGIHCNTHSGFPHVISKSFLSVFRLHVTLAISSHVVATLSFSTF